VLAGSDPIEIAPRTWWVGQHLDSDHFQCHVFLLERGDQSVLFDPGGLLTFDEVWRKVNLVVGGDQVRWLVCHHPDPDTAASLIRLDSLITRPDAAIVTHWRSASLLKHFDLRLPFWLVDEHDWELDVGDHLLKFVFTPYLHFPGAFATFDPTTGALFSSDLFGGFTGGAELYAEDLSYFDSMRPFHEHYMPSQEILAHAIQKLEVLPIRLIAPQHGRLIPEPLVSPIIQKVKTLDCGLYLMVDGDTNIRRLSALNRLLRHTIRNLTVTRDFRETANALLDASRAVFPAVALEFYAKEADGTALRFGPQNRYHGSRARVPDRWAGLMDSLPNSSGSVPTVASGDPDPAIAMALFSPDSTTASGVAILHLSEAVTLHDSAAAALAQLSTPLEVALEREMLLRSLEMERVHFQELAMRDPLTGLYNSRALKAMLKGLVGMHDRGDTASISLITFDIDHFKVVNDRYGHPAGDTILKSVAAVIAAHVREGDLAARVGGEEFSLYVVGRQGEQAEHIADRIRDEVARLGFGEPLRRVRLTMSAGVATRAPGETLESLNGRADAALYEAKTAGRDRVMRAVPAPGQPAEDRRHPARLV
jgi:diguanylate cyclase (GGDEF)-like protein